MEEERQGAKPPAVRIATFWIDMITPPACCENTYADIYFIARIYANTFPDGGYTFDGNSSKFLMAAFFYGKWFDS